MNYTLNQLNVFLKIVEFQSVTKASEILHMTQPAVSIQLKNFQAQFDIPLTEVIGRRIYITEFGKEIAKAAEIIINEVESINNKLYAYNGKLSGKLKIAVVSTGKYVMPYFLNGFLKNNDGVDLIMDVTNKQKVIESVENNNVDLALVSILPQNMNVEKLDLLQNKLYLVGGKNCDISFTKTNKHIFKDLPFIFREQGSGTLQSMLKYLEKNNFTILKKMELTSNEAVKQAIIAGLGFSIMPLIGIKNELKNGDLKIIHVKGLPVKTTWQLIWMKGKKHSPTSLAFLEYLRKEKKNIKEEIFGWYENY